MSMNFANPKTDFVFKRLFGTDAHKNLTISLLNNILGRKPGSLITNVTFYNTENNPIAKGEKESYLDILCKDLSLQEGIFEEGRHEEKEKIALSALQEGLSVPLIQKLTGLSIEQIEQLKSR